MDPLRMITMSVAAGLQVQVQRGARHHQRRIRAVGHRRGDLAELPALVKRKRMNVRIPQASHYGQRRRIDETVDVGLNSFA
jgi:hypothetical protein